MGENIDFCFQHISNFFKWILFAWILSYNIQTQSGDCRQLFHTFLCYIHKLSQGAYRQVYVKFKDFARTSKGLSKSYCFLGQKTYEKY